MTKPEFDIAAVGECLIVLVSEPVETWLPEQIADLLDFANAAGSLATMQKGAIPAMPDEGQIRDA